ncbi:predicted protein [Nematostella vectensis]|uniref:CTCK domain-containing protein n=1 Tax=Nematostella vectensis TaxID=45351 RepID=A7SFF6_NEMVE|nr:sclerostin domain-containing protein 1 [Nematostella vectensis]EDO37569.1 predicted protein [Nematostella vectensis]|eukprot:XP_001629632.1 predicted protein [Nematostella vectensis]
MKLSATWWCCRFAVGLFILSLCCGSGLSHKHVRPERLTPTTKPRAPNTSNTSHGAKTVEENDLVLEQPKQQTGILNLGCVGIRIKRYVSNGFCTSNRAIKDMICEGRCLPMDELPFFPDYSKVLSATKREWRCVPDRKRRRNVNVTCNDGTKRKYRILVVRSCKCKRYTRKQNMTNAGGQPENKKSTKR